MDPATSIILPKTSSESKKSPESKTLPESKTPSSPWIDSDTEDESDNDYEEIMQHWEYDGIKYLLDIGTNELYSPETRQIVAKRKKLIITYSPLRWNWIVVGL